MARARRNCLLAVVGDMEWCVHTIIGSIGFPGAPEKILPTNRLVLVRLLHCCLTATSTDRLMLLQILPAPLICYYCCRTIGRASIH